MGYLNHGAIEAPELYTSRPWANISPLWGIEALSQCEPSGISNLAQ